MTDSSKNSDQHDQQRISEEVLSELMDALRPALSSVGERVSEAVSERLSAVTGSDDDSSDSSDADRDNDGWEIDDKLEDAGESAINWVEDELGDAKDAVVDSVVDPLFSRRVQGHVRNWADETLQQVLWDMVEPIDDRAEQQSLYRDFLRTLRPAVRSTVDAVFEVNTRYELKEEVKAAVPLLMRGEIDAAVSRISSAFDHVLPTAKESFTQDTQHLVWLLQRLSTELLEEEVQEAAENAIDAADIESRVQEKADEARSTLQEKITALQEGVGQAQEQLRSISGTSSSSGGPKPGMPPAGLPPNGFPPHGRPPSGGHPSGRPPHGFPPSGLPPAVERRRKAANSSR